MKRGQTRAEYLADKLKLEQLQELKLKAQIEKEELEQQIYLLQVRDANRKARTRRLIQIGAIFSNTFEVVEQHDLDVIAAFLHEISKLGLEPGRKVNL